VPLEQRLTIVGVSCFLMVVIFELVRKKRLREEYAWLWLVAGLLIFASALVPFRWMQAGARFLGSETPTAVIFFLGFVAVTLLCLQFSVRLSRMTNQIKRLGQKIALLEAEDDGPAP
jgi:hypothetical protein